ncbi:MAG: hypothetical protein EP338_12025 [Bacteroidetes bacterium]|nr:MAG: hypothetical protein EP338_12025 [Bacteroidota bacterium]
MGLFNRRKKKKAGEIQKVALKNVNYHPKIILAWAKAIEGNEELAQYLKDNGFDELNMACAAIRLKQEAREWLMNNGYAQLMAMIHAAEGDEKALRWLNLNDFELLAQIALAVEGHQEAWIWLRTHATQDLFILAQSIKQVKDEIEENHNDIHSFGKD